MFQHWSKNKRKEEPNNEAVKICLEPKMDFETIEPKEPEIPAVKKVINGKLYDTSKAELIFSGSILPGRLGFDFPHSLVGKYFEEHTTIYKGKNEWFCVFRGNIQPLKEFQVREILGEYDVDKYIEFFGEPELA